MKKVFAVTAALALLSLGGIAQAAITIDTVTVGDPGNAGELSGESCVGGGYGPDRICGSVGYSYNIGKYEVTAGQYTAFLNAVANVSDPHALYSKYMAGWGDAYLGCNIQSSGYAGHFSYTVAPDWANRPVNYVSYWDACRFANWLHNGQGSGGTETGAYTLNGYTGYDGGTIQRNAGAKWAVTSEDEWYKAAYYKGGGTNAGYWDYPTRSDSAPSNVGSDGYTDPGNHANYADNITGSTIGSPYYRTIAGEFENSGSAYGTFDQGGNICEWNEAIVYQNEILACRGSRGGSYGNEFYTLLASDRADSQDYPTYEDWTIGFRVSYIPEPSSIIALVGGLAGLLGIRRRKA